MDGVSFDLEHWLNYISQTLSMSHHPYRLIWFQHFHKAGGTSVIRLAKINGENLFPRHNNGLPKYSEQTLDCPGYTRQESQKRIRLEKFSDMDLTAFVDYCERCHVTFVATEWGLPNLDILKQDQRVVLITCLRHPLSRFVSNFYFNLYEGVTRVTEIEKFENSRNKLFLMPNYYCRILARNSDRAIAVNSYQFLQAQAELEKFDHCLILEQGFQPLQAALGWTHVTMRANTRPSLFNLRYVYRLLKHGRLNGLVHQLIYRKKPLSSSFIERFHDRNRWDLRLYDSALNRNALKG